jgi:hypothetical protein
MVMDEKKRLVVVDTMEMRTDDEVREKERERGTTGR